MTPTSMPSLLMSMTDNGASKIEDERPRVVLLEGDVTTSLLLRQDIL